MELSVGRQLDVPPSAAEDLFRCALAKREISLRLDLGETPFQFGLGTLGSDEGIGRPIQQALRLRQVLG